LEARRKPLALPSELLLWLARIACATARGRGAIGVAAASDALRRSAAGERARIMMLGPSLVELRTFLRLPLCADVRRRAAGRAEEASDGDSGGATNAAPSCWREGERELLPTAVRASSAASERGGSGRGGVGSSSAPGVPTRGRAPNEARLERRDVLPDDSDGGRGGGGGRRAESVRSDVCDVSVCS
jgi:hypothetical protein